MAHGRGGARRVPIRSAQACPPRDLLVRADAAPAGLRRHGRRIGPGDDVRAGGHGRGASRGGRERPPGRRVAGRSARAAEQVAERLTDGDPGAAGGGDGRLQRHPRGPGAGAVVRRRPHGSALPAEAPPTATAFETETGRRLDHLLVSSHWTVRSAVVWTKPAPASDHYPVVASLNWAGRPGL